VNLADIGFDPFFSEAFERVSAPGLVPGRVFTDAREVYSVRTAGGDLEAEPSGRLRFEGDLPVAGDWVAVRAFPADRFGVLEAVLPRKSWLSRRAAGKRTEEQLLGANVDLVLATVALGEDGNLRRLERLLALGRAGRATPVALLTKSDLVTDLPADLAAARQVTAGAAVLAVSSRTGAGIPDVRSLLVPGLTAALIGASGAGKSTLVNSLAGEELLATREVREGDGRGRHATTARRLVPLSWGALLLDTPGLREVGLWDVEDGDFDDVDLLGQACRFSDCGHGEEPGCAVRYAVEGGRLDAGRLEAWRKLGREERWLARRLESTPARAEKERWKPIHLQIRKGKRIT
jgi:ribosome biogenesis GTPase